MHALLVALWLVAAQPGAPDAAPAPPPAPAATAPAQAERATGAFIALSVPDLEASVGWYSDMFGLRVLSRPVANDTVKVAILEGDGLVVELIQHVDSRPLRTLAPQASGQLPVHGPFKSGFIVADFDATLARLRARGAEIAFGPFPAAKGQRANLILRDNAGNLVQVFGPAPAP